MRNDYLNNSINMSEYKIFETFDDGFGYFRNAGYGMASMYRSDLEVNLEFEKNIRIFLDFNSISSNLVALTQTLIAGVKKMSYCT